MLTGILAISALVAWSKGRGSIDSSAEACARDDWHACVVLARRYDQGEGVRVPKDPGRATELYVKACALGDRESCAVAGIRLAKQPDSSRGDRRRVIAMLETACRPHGDPDADRNACYHLGMMHAHATALAERDLRTSFWAFGRACDSNVMAACAELAWQLEDGRGCDTDTRRALELYRKACGGGVGLACDRLGRLIGLGQGTALDTAESLATYRRGCSFDDAQSCNDAAYLLAFGIGMIADDQAADQLGARSVELGLKGCNAGDVRACHALAYAYYFGLGVEHDPAKAQSAFVKACENGFQESCAEASALLTIGGGEPGSAPIDRERATKLSAGACDAGVDLGCAYAAYDFTDARELEAAESAAKRALLGGGEVGYAALAGVVALKGKQSNQPQARTDQTIFELYSKGCTLGDSEACDGLAYMYQRPQPPGKDLDAALKFARLGCAQGGLRACTTEAILLRKTDPERSNMILTRLCTRSHGMYGCLALAEQEPERAVELDERACTAQLSNCFYLGKLYYDGKIVAKDLEKALGYFETACDADFGAGCNWAGFLRDGHGDGVVPKDRARAKELYEKACRLGVDQGCKLARK